MQENYAISIKKENQSIYIFCKDGTTLDCKTIHNIIFESIKNNETHKDINMQDMYDYIIYIFLDSVLLLGSSESTNNPLFFGELDKNGEFIESKPIYQLISNEDSKTESNIIKAYYNNKTESNNMESNKNIDSNSIDSKTHNKESSNSLSTLHIFLNNSSLIILNYSLLNSSLNIKLECKSKESKEIAEKEQKEHIQRKQIQKDSNSKDSIQSTAFLHPVLEDNEIKCPHNGVVKLKSNKGKPFTSKGIPMVLESDLINSHIIGCTNNIAGIPTPCMQVALILPSARAFKKYNDDYPIMQENALSFG